jgi:hypothetical protein
MGDSLQVIQRQNDRTADGIHIPDLRLLTTCQPAKIIDHGDLLEFDVQEQGDSLLILSQQFHRDWQASGQTASGWTALNTVPVNDVFQGVLLTGEVHKVRIQFLPYVRFAWIAHAFWLLMLTGLTYQAIGMRFAEFAGSAWASRK